MINSIMPSNTDRVNTTGFTSDQQKAYTELMNFIINPFNSDDYKRALVGPAGTGKTYLVKALIRNSNISFSVIGLAAPTHKACRVLNNSIKLPNINVHTLQSDLGLRINFNIENFDIKNPPFDPKGRVKIGDYRLYIVDEASMINRDLCIFLEKLCKDNKCKILYIGDDAQLAPVGEKYSSALKGLKTSNLNQIVRQGEDNPISYLLELLRYDIKNKTFKFLEYISKTKSSFNQDNTKGFAVLNPTEFNKMVYINFSDEAIVKNIDFAKIISYTNNKVSGWNKVVRNAIIADADKSVINKNDLIISYSTLVNQFNDAIIKNSEEYIIRDGRDIVNWVHPRYQLKGFMVKFTAIHGGQTTTPLFIIDHKDAFTIQHYVQIARNLIQTAINAPSKLRAQHWKNYFEFKDSCLLLTNIIKKDGTIEFERSLDYGFALTSHKSQGSTFDTVLVDVNDIVYNKHGKPYSDIEEMNRRLYVACSRCKNKLYLQYGN